MQINNDLRHLLKAYLDQLGKMLGAATSEIEEMRQQLIAMPDDALVAFKLQLETLAQEQGCQLKAPPPPAKQAQKSLLNTQPCRECQHYVPDKINPPSGLGNCIEFPWRPGEPLFWPPMVRQCGRFTAKNK